jgi:hypothetical protein
MEAVVAILREETGDLSLKWAIVFERREAKYGANVMTAVQNIMTSHGLHQTGPRHVLDHLPN